LTLRSHDHAAITSAIVVMVVSEKTEDFPMYHFFTMVAAFSFSTIVLDNLFSSFPSCKIALLFSCTTMHKVDIEGALQAPLQLRELYIAASRLQKIPESIGQLKHLEKIVLRGDDIRMALETLPEEFCQLPSLKHLELNCPYLKSLPDSFGNLTSLQHVKLYSVQQFGIAPRFLWEFNQAPAY
jgi:hypothetical protein